MFGRPLRFTFTLMLLAVAVAAQEAPGPPKYFYLLESSVEPEHMGSFSAAVAQTARAHAQHPRGNSWVAYRKVTGGPEARVVFLFPFTRMAELDRWKPSRRVLVDVLGRQEGREVFNFGVGQPDFDTPEVASDKAVRILRAFDAGWSAFEEDYGGAAGKKKEEEAAPVSS